MDLRKVGSPPVVGRGGRANELDVKDRTQGTSSQEVRRRSKRERARTKLLACLEGAGSERAHSRGDKPVKIDQEMKMSIFRQTWVEEELK